MEFIEHTFAYGLSKTPSIHLYPDTFILITGIKPNQKLVLVYGCAYIETSQKEYKTESEYDLLIPGKNERLMSFQKLVTEQAFELKCKFFFGKLEELLLAELYYKNHMYERTLFNYSKKELRFGMVEHDFIYIKQVSQTKYQVQYYMKQPIGQHTGIIVFDNLCNEFKLLENLFKKIKLNPPPAQPEVHKEQVSTLIKKYFPIKPYTKK